MKKASGCPADSAGKRGHLLDSLALARYRITLEALETLSLPAYLGSTLRGACGHAFRRLCCPVPDGASCPIPDSCPYHVVFETAPPPGAEALRTHDDIPRPFVIAPLPAATRTEHPPGSELMFDAADHPGSAA